MRTDAPLWSIAAEIRKETQAAQQDQSCHPSSPRSRATQRDYSRSTRLINAGRDGVVWNNSALGAGHKKRRQEIPDQLRSLPRESSEQRCLLADSDFFTNIAWTGLGSSCGSGSPAARGSTRQNQRRRLFFGVLVSLSMFRGLFSNWFCNKSYFFRV